MYVTAHYMVRPVVSCSIDSPLIPFLWLVKRRLKNVSDVQAWGVAVVAGVGYIPKKIWM